MEEFKIYCCGKFKKTDNKYFLKSPYNNENIAEVYCANKIDLNEAIEKAIESTKELKKLSSFDRYEILVDISRKIEDNKKRLAELISLETAKPIKYSIAEVERAKQVFIIAAEETKRLPKEYFSIDWTPAGRNKEGFVKYFPIGLIAGISPFNFPLNLSVHKIAPAIASGNPIILKPASQTPLAILELAKIIDSANLPKGALSILPCDRETGNILVTDDRIKMLSFTGSPEVGWEMKKHCGKKKIALELGGNAGVIVSKSAKINETVTKCINGSFAFSGQICIHTQRIYVHYSIFEAFINEFVEKTKKLKFGNPLDIETDISAMIDEKNALRVEQWIKNAENDGAKILAGGKRHNSFVEPSILTNTNNKMQVVCEEVFGPVVIIEKFDNFESAVEEINNSKFGLQAGVFTDSIDEMNYSFENIETGGVIINDVPTFRVDHMPYGGIKDSGLGREGIRYSIHEMMEPKLLIRNIY